MSSWDILGGNGGNDNDDEEVEYVGVIEEDAPPVQEPRRNVRRVAPRRMPMDQPVYAVSRSMRNQNGVVGAPNRDEEDLVSYVNIPYGKQLGLTPEAIDRLQNTPMTSMNGQMSQRLEPGTYVMYGPNRTNDMSGMGTNDAPGWIGGLIEGVSTLTAGITGAAVTSAASRREADTARYLAELERDAASEARQWAFQEAQLEQSVRLAEIEQAGQELAVLQEQAAAAAALEAAAPTTVVASTGTSPVVWILVALLGVGAVGGIIYAVSKKDD